MCDPITLTTVIGGLAASAAGTGLQVAASNKEQSAMNQAAQNEINLQNQYAQQGKNVFEQSLEKSTPQAVQGQQQQGAQKALQEYTSLQGQQLPNMQLNTQPVAPSKQVDVTQDAITQSKIGQQNQAGATLQGYGASDVAQAIKDLQAKTQLGQIGQFAQGSANLLPIQLQAAQQSQQGMAGIGSLLSSIGGLGALFGAVAKRPQTPSYPSGWGSPLIPGTGSYSQPGYLNMNSWNPLLGAPFQQGGV